MIEQISLNSYWKFILDNKDEGRQKGWHQDIPEGASDILVPACWSECNEDWYHYEGVVWYFKRFIYRRNDSVKRNILFFYGVNHSCEIWMNGCYTGSHTGGFTPFEIDVTPILKRDEENFIAIRVDSTMTDRTVPPIGVDWFNFGGIFREVYLNGTGESWLDDVFVKTRMDGHVDIEVQIGNFTSRECDQIHIIVEDEEELRPALDKVITIKEPSGNISFRLENPKLWSPESPFLYRFTLELLKENSVEDRWQHPIGIREYEIRDRRILLNGKPIMLRGYSKHEEYPLHARTFSHDIVKKDYELCKKGNANFLRLCHYPHHLKEYEIASEMGFVVMAEVPNVNFTKTQFESVEMLQNSTNQAKEILKYYKNETCIMLWSLFIECRTDEDSAVEFVPEYIQLFKKADPTRFTIHASLIPLEDRTYNFFDIVGINYWSGWYYGETVGDGSVYLDKIAAKYPDKPVIITSGGWEGIFGYHSYRAGQKWSEEEQVRYLVDVSRMYISKDYIVGEIIWTFNDFRVSPWVISRNAKWTQRPMETNHKGVLDFYRRPKLSYYAMQDVFKEWDQKLDASKKGVIA